MVGQPDTVGKVSDVSIWRMVWLLARQVHLEVDMTKTIKDHKAQGEDTAHKV